MADNDKANAAREPEPSPSTPRRWWQWFLVYPSLAIAVLGGAPTYIEAFKSYSLGVPFGQSFDAEQQNRLWQENFECAQKAQFTNITTKKKVEIGSAICDSGDVLLRGKRPEWDRAQLRWVSWSDVAPVAEGHSTHAWWFDFLSSAHAAGRPPVVVAQAGPTVICSRWVGQGQLLQRIRTPRGCFDQIINTYRGMVISSRPAPCIPSC